MPVTRIAPPAPQQASSATVKPSLAQPNHEQTLADVRVSSALPATLQAAIQPATTSPLVVHAPDPAQKLPETASKQHQAPTPTAVVSITPVKMVDGTIALPAANQTAATSPVPGRPTPDRPNPVSDSGTGKGKSGSGSADHSAIKSALNAPQQSTGSSPAAQTGSKGSAAIPKPSSPNKDAGASREIASARDGTGSASPAAKSGPAPGAGSARPDASGSSGVKTASSGSMSGDASPNTSDARSAAKSDARSDGNSGDKSGSGAGSGDSASEAKISFPKDGHFGAVVIGASLEDEYPETQGVWNDRLAYTVYLHVGLARNWILQYALTRAADPEPTQRPDAPFPYDITRPHLAPGELNSDALLVHGFVNTSGKFEQLSVAFPPDFGQANFILTALQKWQFRPAMQQGQPIKVEVLLIIPNTWD
jgi:hypothetical protein